MILLQAIPEPRVVVGLSEGWMLPVMVGLLSLVAVVNVFNRRLLMDSIQALAGGRAARETALEEGGDRRQLGWMLVVVSWVSTSLLFYLALHLFPQHPPQLAFWKILTVVGLAFLLKQLVMELVHAVTGGNAVISAYRQEFRLGAFLQGILLLPFLLFAVYGSQDAARMLLAVCLSIVAFAYVVRTLHGGWMAFQSRTPTFYIIFYLCSLEILPIAVLAKLVASAPMG